MDNIYSKSNLKKFLNQVYANNVDNQIITNFFSTLVNETKSFSNIENNNYILFIIKCINRTNLTYQNIMLMDELFNTLLMDALEIKDDDKDNNKLTNMDIEDYDCLDLDDKDNVKAYFLKKNKYLKNNGKFPYPPKGETSVITTGDNITIPGIMYYIDYVIDHEGKILDIKGYPRKRLEQEGYEQVYAKLMDSIFKE